ncbi:hypothetical protein MLD38_039966 [Melastoma candidum]|uniref:Uncharacterized protein n=1 Tax=Melastoma candidum TaxID=119954 RepID=A0ACB9L5D0_9MYRT|nr:hypothetical protein MLD38_039966 [Melastoma candidum]
MARSAPTTAGQALWGHWLASSCLTNHLDELDNAKTKGEYRARLREGCLIKSAAHKEMRIEHVSTSVQPLMNES